MTAAKLPSTVIQAEKAMDAVGFESLGEMRWHWTANEDNPDRVSQSEYARQTGRHRTSIRESVERFLTGDPVKTAAAPVDNRGGARVAAVPAPQPPSPPPAAAPAPAPAPAASTPAQRAARPTPVSPPPLTLEGWLTRTLDSWNAYPVALDADSTESVRLIDALIAELTAWRDHLTGAA